MHNKGFQGISFGVMDAVVTILGIMLGLSITQNKSIILIGILAGGIADSFANAAGMHVSQETEKHHSKKEVLRSTLFCFFATLFTILVLASPLLVFSLKYAIISSIILGIIILLFLGIFVSKMNDKFISYKLIIEYLLIGIVVSLISFLIGIFISDFNI